MRGTRDRSQLERDLASALCRHIGYTTGAYHLDRIVATLEVFRDSPSAYLNEIVERARLFVTDQSEDSQDERLPGDKYLEEIVHFAQAMSLITTVSQKHAQVRRFAPTERGRALSGVRATGDKKFFRYFLTKTILLADADALFPVMDYFYSKPAIPSHVFYHNFQNSLRMTRWRWLKRAFSQPLLYSRVATNISWLSTTQRGSIDDQVEIISENTARHHSTPRVGWLQRLGILDTHSRNLTMFGESTRTALLGKDEYFWLGPAATTQQELGITNDQQAGGPYEDTFDLTVGKLSPSEDESRCLVDDTVGIMRDGYFAAKLVHAAQATLTLPIEYIKFRSFVDGKKYEWTSTLSRLFSDHRNEFERLSAKRGQVGFYKWKGF